MFYPKTAALSGILLCADVTLPAPDLDFNRDIRRLLADRCFTCHGPDPTKRVTKPRFHTEAGAHIDLSQGRHSIVPSDPGASELSAFSSAS